MAKRPDITTVASGYFGREALNNNFQQIRAAFNNTLSLDGSTPNAMQADLDLNGNGIANVSSLLVDGQDIVAVTRGYRDTASAAAVEAGLQATNAAAQATITANSFNNLQPYLNEIQVIGDDLTAGTFVAGTVYDFGDITETVSGTSGSPDGFIVSVFSNLDNIEAVADIDTDVTSVAGIGTEVVAVAGNEVNIGAVGAIASDVTTVASISADVTSAVGISADITAVAADATDIGLVAASIADVNTVAGITADIAAVVADEADIGLVATDIANVNTVAANLVNVNSFGETYRIGTADPTTSLDTGDLFFNSTSGVLKVYDGTGWTAGVTAGSGFLALTGGTLTGALLTTSTIDGRDVATDGTKLDGIEVAATADQTGAEIKTAYEAEADTNAFTDAEKTKLGAVAASATNYADAEVDTHLNTSTATSGQYLGWNGSDYSWSTVDLSTKLDLAGGTLTGTLNGTSAVFSGDVTATNVNTTSDKTLKENVETIKAPVETVQQLRGVTFDWIGNGASDLGVIAQEVEEVLPDLVRTSDDGLKSVKYSNMVGLLIEAVKDQQAQIDELKAKLGAQ
jgi:hypothetical protein